MFVACLKFLSYIKVWARHLEDQPHRVAFLSFGQVDRCTHTVEAWALRLGELLGQLEDALRFLRHLIVRPRPSFDCFRVPLDSVVRQFDLHLSVLFKVGEEGA